MEIILLENIYNLGNIGDKVRVKMAMEEIFIKQGKALRFNKENEELVNKKKMNLKRKIQKLKINLKK